MNRRQGTGYAFVSSTLGVVSVAALLVGLLSWARLAPWSAVERVAAPSSDAQPWTDVNQWGVNTFLASEVEAWKRDKTLDMIQAAGIGWIKQSFAWNEIEPREGSFTDEQVRQDTWRKYDKIVDRAAERGIRVIARLDQTPSWARGPGTTPATPPIDAQAFGNFVDAFVRHFAGRVTFIQIWNEPNLAAEWGGAVDPDGYAALLRIAAARARAANPSIVILSAPLAMTNENSARAWNELRYWQALYDRGAANSFDIMTANSYGLDRAFDDPPGPQTLNFRRVELLRDLEERNGDARKPIWLDEYGWNAAPADFPADKLTWSRVTDAEQAAWTVAGVRYAREHWPWLGVANIWYFRQVGDIPIDRAEYYFRMVDVEFAPRDVYTAVQRAAQTGAVARVGTLGDLSPPVLPLGKWSVVPDGAATGGEYVLGSAGARLRIRIAGSGLALGIIPALTHGRARVRISAGAAAPDASSAWREIRLDAPSATLTIVDGDGSTTAQQTQTIEIAIEEGSALALDSIQTTYTRSYDNVVLAAVVVCCAAGASVILKRGARRAVQASSA